MTTNEDNEEVILETREDLTFFLKNTPYEYVVLKFSADWCKPCKKVKPIIDGLINEKTKKFEAHGAKIKFIFVSVDVDECFDLYAFRKAKNVEWYSGIVSLPKKVYQKNEDKQIYIPQAVFREPTKVK